MDMVFIFYSWHLTMLLMLQARTHNWKGSF